MIEGGEEGGGLEGAGNAFADVIKASPIAGAAEVTCSFTS